MSTEKKLQGYIKYQNKVAKRMLVDERSRFSEKRIKDKTKEKPKVKITPRNYEDFGEVGYE